MYNEMSKGIKCPLTKDSGQVKNKTRVMETKFLLGIYPEGEVLKVWSADPWGP